MAPDWGWPPAAPSSNPTKAASAARTCRAAAPGSGSACRQRHDMNHPASSSKDSRRQPALYIVDDDDGMRRALSVLMGTVGYQIITFAKPSEFLAQFGPT